MRPTKIKPSFVKEFEQLDRKCRLIPLGINGKKFKIALPDNEEYNRLYPKENIIHNREKSFS